jgi:hypothetical protein
MTRDAQHSRRLWDHCLSGVKQEYGLLAPRERDWILERLGQMADLQKQLDELFVAADGPAACRQCSGACCDSGKNHFTLANLLAFVSVGQLPPDPDFSLVCPFLGEAGCRIEVSRRPFNCITFACDQVLDSLGSQRERYFHLEKALHAHYLAFDRRYSGSSLCGLLIRAERLAGHPFLSPV